MNEIYILFLILGSLYIIENKSINLLAYYIGMVIIIAITISSLTVSGNSGINYISYILVLVQISALTILFGFIIMLFPNNNTEILIKQKNITNKNSNKIKKNKLLLFFFFVTIILLFVYNNINQINKLIIDILNILFENNILLNYNVNNNYNSPNNWDDNNTKIFIKKICYLLYGEPSNILKFMIITIILFFAIICLFYILFPTLII